MEFQTVSDFIPSSPYEARLLRKVARAWGIQPSYRSIGGETQWTPVSTLNRMIETLSDETFHDVHALKAIFHKKIELLKKTVMKPIQVAIGDEKISMRLYLQPHTELHSVFITVRLEDGGSHLEEIPVESLRTRTTDRVLRVDFDLADRLPLGYHEIRLTMGHHRGQGLLIRAPLSPFKSEKKTWGAFLPLHGLQNANSWGIGSLSELHQAWNLLHDQGVDWIGTLPLLASNLDHPDCDPSPYSAVTRLFWNEAYLDIDALVEQYDVPAVVELMKTPEFREEKERLRALNHVDYHACYQLKKGVLTHLAEHFFDEGLDESPSFKRFVDEYPEIWDYAIFRSDDSREQRYHVFCQYHMNRSLHRLCDEYKTRLYLDYPVGVSESGFDNFQFKDLFLNEVSAGAPPDPLAEGGQNWGFAAFRAEELQKSGYEYLRRSLQNHFKFSRLLRIDHIMGFYRLYVIPKGLSGKDGVYLRYPAHEWFAVACLEAQKAGADIIGEDLGTVPDAVREMMNQHDINGMWILEMEAPQPAWSRREPPRASLSGFNTHDMPTYRGFLEGIDLHLLAEVGIIPQERIPGILAERLQHISNWKDAELEPNDFEVENTEEMLLRSLEYLCDSKSRYMLVNIEDLWGETHPQNIPGTWKEYPNWRKKLSYPIEEWREHSLFNRALDILRRRC